MPGGLLQLVLYGGEDFYLTGNPQISFFKSIFKRYTNFAMETIPLQFNVVPNTSAGNTTMTCKIERYADLLKGLFLKIRLPPIHPYNYKFNKTDNPINFWIDIGGTQITDGVMHLVSSDNGTVKVEGFIPTDSTILKDILKTITVIPKEFLGYLNFPAENVSQTGYVTINEINPISDYNNITFTNPPYDINSLPQDSKVNVYTYDFIRGEILFLPYKFYLQPAFVDPSTGISYPATWFCYFSGTITDFFYYDYTQTTPIDPSYPHYWMNIATMTNSDINGGIQQSFESSKPAALVSELNNDQTATDLLNVNIILNNLTIDNVNSYVSLISEDNNYFLNYQNDYQPVLPFTFTNVGDTYNYNDNADFVGNITGGLTTDIYNTFAMQATRTINGQLLGTMDDIQTYSKDQLFTFSIDNLSTVPVITIPSTLNYPGIYISDSLVGTNLFVIFQFDTQQFILQSVLLNNYVKGSIFLWDGINPGTKCGYAEGNLENIKCCIINGYRELTQIFALNDFFSVPLVSAYSTLFFPGALDVTSNLFLATNILTLTGQFNATGTDIFNFTDSWDITNYYTTAPNFEIPIYTPIINGIYKQGLVRGTIVGQYDGVNITTATINFVIWNSIDYITAPLPLAGRLNGPNPNLILPSFENIYYFEPIVNQYDNSINYKPINNAVGSTKNFRWKLNFASKVYFYINSQEIVNINGLFLYSEAISNVEYQKLQMTNRLFGVIPDLIAPDVDAETLQTLLVPLGVSGAPPRGYPTPEYTIMPPMNVWFMKHSGNALPLIALQNSPVEFRVDFYPTNTINTTSGGFNQNQWYSGIPYEDIRINDISVEADYVYLDKDERIKFTSVPQQYLITQYQENLYAVPKSKMTFTLNFTHPVSELTFGASSITDFYQYPYGAIFGVRPDINYIKNLKLLFNGYERLQEKQIQYFNTMQPYMYHDGDSYPFYNFYSFSLDPQSQQPKGSCNFTKISYFTMEVVFDERFINKQVVYDSLTGQPVTTIDPTTGLVTIEKVSTENPTTTFFIWAKSYNILSIQDGVGGMKFAN
jgi:hypothetical protein